jgi:hypothetical protein
MAIISNLTSVSLFSSIDSINLQQLFFNLEFFYGAFVVQSDATKTPEVLRV